MHDDITNELGGFNDIVATRIREDGVEVSQSKSVVSASAPSLGAAVMDKLKPRMASSTRSGSRAWGWVWRPGS